MCRTPTTPGVYVEELPEPTPAIEAAPTAVTAFVGRTAQGPPDEPVAIRSFGDFERTFGSAGSATPLGYALAGYFQNGGGEALVVRRGVGELHTPEDHLGSAGDGTGLFALTPEHAFNVLCIPPDGPDQDVPGGVYAAAAQFCVERRAFLLVDPPTAWARKWREGRVADIALADLGTSFSAEQARNAAVYFPRLRVVDGASGLERMVAPSGAVAGVLAATDRTRGVWKAPAGMEASLSGVAGLEVDLDAAGQEVLNPKGINGLRVLPQVGPVVWGARTLRGGVSGDEFRYVPVRRLFLHIEDSIRRGTEWVASEANGEPLWARVRQAVEQFLSRLFRAGAFQGATPREAYFVKCDQETMTQTDIDVGRVVVLVGFAPMKPAEFVVARVELPAGLP